MDCAKVKCSIADDIKTKIYVFVGGVGTMIIAIGVYKFFYRFVTEDNYFSSVKWHGGNTQRRILVLGLAGAGKTRLLQCFDKRSKPWVLLPSPAQSFGVNVKSAGLSGIDYHFWDVCYDEQGHNWAGLVWNMDVLLWVVDSCRPELLQLSRASLHRCVQVVDQQEQDTKESDSRRNNYGIPIVIVATKQDFPQSISTDDVLKALDVDELRMKHKVYIVGTQVPNLGNRKGLWRLYELISWAERKRYN